MDRLDGVGSDELRTALMYVRSSSAAVTADDAAMALGVHRSVARDRLERLLRAGLLSTHFARRSGRTGPGAGRPAKLYAPAPEPSVLEFPPRRLPVLVAHLIDVLPRRRRQRQLRQVGEEFGRELARESGLEAETGVRDGAEAVCSALRSCGFNATLQAATDERVVISTLTCPLRPLVAERLEAAYLDRGMWAGLVECGVHGVRARDVDCETDACLDDAAACTVVVSLRG